MRTSGCIELFYLPLAENVPSDVRLVIFFEKADAKKFKSTQETCMNCLSFFTFLTDRCQEILKALKIFSVNAFSKEMFSSSLNLFQR